MCVCVSVCAGQVQFNMLVQCGRAKRLRQRVQAEEEPQGAAFLRDDSERPQLHPGFLHSSHAKHASETQEATDVCHKTYNLCSEAKYRKSRGEYSVLT